MNCIFIRRTFATLVALWLFLGQSAPLFARGGVSWGYYNEAQGYPILNLWLMSNPWSQMSGWAIPHHSLDPPGYDPGLPPPRNPLSGPWRTQPLTDRSVLFPGSSNQPATASAPVRTVYIVGAPQGPSEPYRIDRSNDPPYYQSYNAYWRNGYWGGGLWGWSRWGGALGTRAFPRWMLGPVYYSSGYGLYSNPFISDAAPRTPSGPDYSRPLADASAVETSLGNPITDPKPSPNADLTAGDSAAEIRQYFVKSPQVIAGLKSLDAARDAFRGENYDLALRHADEALKHVPADPAFHEFRALVLFAQGDYRRAAQAIYAVLAVSPGWNWTTLSNLYAHPEEYTRQLRRLEIHKRDNSEAADAAFLLAYHYVTARHNDAAVRQLQAAAKRLPKDPLIPAMEKLVAAGVETSSAHEHDDTLPPRPEDAVTPADPLPEIDKSRLIGQWQADRGPDSRVTLTMTEDGKFVWLAHQDGTTRRLEGVGVMEGDLMGLTWRSGSMVGRVTLREEGGFNLTLSEDDPADPGIEFRKP